MHCFPATLFCFLYSYDFRHQSFVCNNLAFSSILTQSCYLQPPQFLFLPFNSIGLKASIVFSYLLVFHSFFFRFNFQFFLEPNFLRKQPLFTFFSLVFFSCFIPFPLFVDFICEFYSFYFCLTSVLSITPSLLLLPSFFSTFLVTFNPSPHLSFCPVILFLSIPLKSGCRNMFIDLGILDF